MPLSTRIAVFVSLAFALAFAALIAVGLQREALLSRPQARIALAGEEALWRKIVEVEAAELAELRERLAGDAAFREAAASGDLPRLRRVASVLTRGLLMSERISDLQVLDAQGRVLHALSAQAEPPPLLDVSTLSALAEGAGAAGMRQVSAGAFRVVSAAAFVPWNGQPTVLALGLDASRPLELFSEAMEADAFLLSTRGRLVAGTDEKLWSVLRLELPQRTGSVLQARHADRLFSVTAIPVADVSAGSAGLLVAVQDATQNLAALDRLTRATALALAGVAVLTVGGLWIWLRRSFEPLRQAVGALGALARGDLAARVDVPAGRAPDEIGRIAVAVSRLARSLRAVEDDRRRQELQRRRQERFVRRQMEQLAGTLEPGAREEVLNDLRRIVEATRGARPEGEEAPAAAADDPLARLIREDDQLGPIAAVLQQMSGRVVEQHRRLSELVARLRESLVRETRLASLQQELAIARELQRSVLPGDMAERAGYRVKGVMDSAQEVGGDFFDFFERGDGRLVFVIADVSGKGVPAAFFMAIARTLLKAIALFEPDPARCVRQLNDLLAVDNDRMMFVTLVFGVLDPATGRVEIVNAGHLPPVRLPAAGAPTLVPPTGDMAVAVAEGLDFAPLSLDLAPGESLVLYTDGVTEAFDAGGDQFGEARMLSALARLGGSAPEAVAAAMIGAVKRFETGAEQSDDVTLLVVQRR